MNKYLQLKRQHERERKRFPIFFANDENAFEKGMQKLGLEPTDTDSICTVRINDICVNGFIRRKDVTAFRKMINRHKKEKRRAMLSDSTGQFAFDMFYYELCNHEYKYTHDATSALAALGYTIEDIRACIYLENAFEKAKARCENEISTYCTNAQNTSASEPS